MGRLRIALVVLIAAVAGWVVRGIDLRSDDAPRPVIVTRDDGAGPSLEPPENSLVVYATHDDQVRTGSRNVFAYVDPPPPVVRRESASIQLAVVPAKLENFEPVTPREPQPPRFTHRYIGTFGTDNVRLAAFARDDGEVITVRTGDSINGQFTLHSIGIESVEVTHTATRTTQRIPLGAR